MATATTFEFNTLDSNTDVNENAVSYRRSRTPERNRGRRPKYSRSGSRSGGATNGFHRRHAKKWSW